MTEIRIYATIRLVRDRASFDVLVVGSGAAGLAAAVSAELLRRARRRSRRRRRCRRATRRRRREASRRRSARTTRPRSMPRTSCALARDGGPEARRGADERGAVRDPLARGDRSRVHALERRVPARTLRRRDAAPAAPGRRPHRPRDHEGAARDVRGGRWRRAAAPRPALASRPTDRAGRPRSRRRRAPPTVEAARARARRRRTLLRRGGDARRALDEPPERDRRGDAHRHGRRRGDARPRRAPVPPERRRVAVDDAGLLDPGDDARVRRRPAERGRRGVHRLPRPARRRLAGDLRRGRGRARRAHRGRPARRLARHDPHRSRRTPRSRFRTCCAATAAPGSIRSPSRSTRTPSSTTRTVGS